jgi:hypothetical protein
MTTPTLQDMVNAFYTLVTIAFLGAWWSYSGKDKIGKK